MALDHEDSQAQMRGRHADVNDSLATGSVREVFWVFLVLGCTAFGGPAAHIAAMEDAIVRRRQWVTEREFLDLLSAANVIPGPNSTELAIHLGLRRAGWRGLIAAGVGFIGPATVMVWALAIVYTSIGQRPDVVVMLAGMQPVVLAVVLQAVWRLAGKVLRTRVLIAIAVVSTIAVLFGVHELLILAGAALVGAVLAGAMCATPEPKLPTDAQGKSASKSGPRVSNGSAMATVPWISVSPMAASKSSAVISGTLAMGAIGVGPTALTVFTTFLKIGSVLFGSGYVLLAFLRAELVERHAWLTEPQLLDAIAIGQVTPGPVFTSATFIGYLLAGNAGAATATLGIFLPAFLFVAVSGPLIRVIRRSPRLSAALDSVNAASLALMAGVMLIMLRPVATSAVSMGIFLSASLLLITTRIGAGWTLLFGALLGMARMLLT